MKKYLKSILLVTLLVIGSAPVVTLSAGADDPPELTIPWPINDRPPSAIHYPTNKLGWPLPPYPGGVTSPVWADPSYSNVDVVQRQWKRESKYEEIVDIDYVGPANPFVYTHRIEKQRFWNGDDSRLTKGLADGKMSWCEADSVYWIEPSCEDAYRYYEKEKIIVRVYVDLEIDAYGKRVPNGTIRASKITLKKEWGKDEEWDIERVSGTAAQQLYDQNIPERTWAGVKYDGAGWVESYAWLKDGYWMFTPTIKLLDKEYYMIHEFAYKKNMKVGGLNQIAVFIDTLPDQAGYYYGQSCSGTTFDTQKWQWGWRLEDYYQYPEDEENIYYISVGRADSREGGDNLEGLMPIKPQAQCPWGQWVQYHWVSVGPVGVFSVDD